MPGVSFHTVSFLTGNVKDGVQNGHPYQFKHQWTIASLKVPQLYFAINELTIPTLQSRPLL